MEIDEARREKMTFVFVTPRSWDNASLKLPDLERSYREKKDFADVKIIDAPQLQDWIEQREAVGARYAREILPRIPQFGLRDTNEFWREFSNLYSPTLTEDVVLCARQAQADTIIHHLLATSGSLVYLSDGPDEVTALAVAAIRRADEGQRKYLEARTLIVDTDEAGRTFTNSKSLSFIVSPSAQKSAGPLSKFGPVVTGMGMDTTRKGYERLSRASRTQMQQALITIGLSEEKALDLAIRSGSSLTILERHAPAAGYQSPAWAGNAEVLLPALLAGAWDGRLDTDKEIVSILAGGAEYADVEARLRPYLAQSDSPIERESGVWKLRAPVDALLHLRDLIGDEHRPRLEKAVQHVFAYSPAITATTSPSEKRQPYSQYLRDGLASTLLMIARLHAEIDLDFSSERPADFVERVVGDLPGLRDDYRVIMSLENQLPVLMEAAPDPLLSALESLLEGHSTEVGASLSEDRPFGERDTPMPHVLWALETMAWQPDRLPQVTEILARLALIDPGGRYTNRPINTLREIYLAWHPGTNATVEERLVCLDNVVRNHPDLGWTLLASLLPKNHDSASPTRKPRFADAEDMQPGPLTVENVRYAYEGIIDRVLQLAADNPERLIAIAESYPRFDPDRRGQFLDLVADWGHNAAPDGKAEVRAALSRVAARHGRFRKADWALPDADFLRLQEVIVTLESADPIERARVIFDERTIPPSSDYIGHERQAEEARRAEVLRLASSGAARLLDLAARVRFPRQVAASAAAVLTDEKLIKELIFQAIAGSETMQAFAEALASAVRYQRGQEFDGVFFGWCESQSLDAMTVARLVLSWPEVPATWSLVEYLGTEPCRFFWQNRDPRHFSGTHDELTVLVGFYLHVGRATAALNVIHGREEELSWKLLKQLLQALIDEPQEPFKRDVQDNYLIQELFRKLSTMGSVPLVELANWEFSFLSALEDETTDLALFQLMGTDPEFFVSILSEIFIADDQDPDTRSEDAAKRERARVAYRAYMHFSRLPGDEGGTVDDVKLNGWVDGVIREAEIAKRSNIAMSAIGRTLAHSPEIAGNWPPEPVAAVIERLASPQLENALAIERFNMRGVYHKLMFSGGDQERDLAAKYDQWRKALNPVYARTRAMLATISKNWREDAEREDDRANRDRIRFDP
ncbi:hypothetical protein [Agrobacterium tumefaciens]|uniref:hypothetical protein n=1 Tax=Agrobacterium tumefaciens TaxID=358 RepID=UPI001053E764|nr:hypothetical protein [Agrobacterium tumefaciens]